MNVAKAARMSRDLKFGYKGFYDHYTDKQLNSKLERVRRYFDKW